MNNFEKITLCFCANIRKYNLIINDGCNCYCIIVNSSYQCISFTPIKRQIKIMACPLIDGYNQNICFILDIECNKSCNNILLNFIQNPSYDKVKYNFTLTDKIYGLPINGSLNFTQTD